MPVRGRERAALATIFLLVLLCGCAVHRNPTLKSGAEPGWTEFQSYCTSCHQSDGRGVGEAPPLAGSPWVAGPESRLIKIVLHGVRGRMEVAGRTYDLEMPGFGQVLSDESIASLLSFVRKRFGAASDSVTPDSVRRIRDANRDRTDYWNVSELLEEP